MPIWKANYFFTQRKQGWSETWYLDRSAAGSALEAMKNIMPLRVALLGGVGLGASDPRLEEIRVSNIAVDRDSLVYAVPPGDQFNSALLGVADNPNLCLLVRLEAGALYRRSWSLRGFPDSLITNNGIYVADAAWQPRFDAFITAVRNRLLGMVAWDRAAPIVAISAIGPPDPVVKNLVTITTAAPHGLIVGDRFKIISAPGTSNLRGTWTVFSLGLGNIFTFFSRKEYGGAYIGGGRLTKKTPAFFNFDNAEIERASHRITGRPFDLSVGRRRKRAIA